MAAKVWDFINFMQKNVFAEENVKPLSNEMTSLSTTSNDIKNIERVVKSVMSNLVSLVEKNLIDVINTVKISNNEKKKQTRDREIRRLHTVL